MAAGSDGAQAAEGSGGAVMRSFVRGTLAQKPEYVPLMGGGEVCRMLVLGEAPGPATSPPQVSLYIHSGEAGPQGLRPDEARRCAFGLRPGDMIQAVGDIGPERSRARRQEVLVTERVKLCQRAGVAA